MTNLRNCLFVSLSILTLAGVSSAQDGAALYRTYCAICHEGARADAQAPSREVMKRMSAEQILQSLESGSMRQQAVYVLDAKTGCVHWTLEVEASVRSALTLDARSNGDLVAYFGDQTANVYAVDAKTGRVLWKVEVDEYPHAAITAAPQLYNGRLFVPVSSREESQVGDPRYPCCQFRGSVVALDATTGRRVWKTYTVSETPVPTVKNSIGTQLYGPAGGAIWNTPTIDTTRNVLYVGTGNNFAPPATDASDSLVAFDLNTGEIRWVRQVTENDIWNGSCGRPDREAAVCPDKDAPDFDFTGSPLLVDVGNGRQLIVVGNKSGVIFAFDPDVSGKLVWQRRVAKGGTSGGVFWGSAADGVNIYAAHADFVAANPDAGGGMSAVELRTGRLVWNVPGAGCANMAESFPVMYCSRFRWSKPNE